MTRSALLAAVVVATIADGLLAQSLTYTRGQNVAPAYEGWEQGADGTKYFLFGYMNRNWEEEIDVPVGPDNSFNVGAADQGQPTHFLPRRNRFVFKVRVPKDFGTKEIVWTLTSHGKTEKAWGTLKPDYVIADRVIMANVGAGGQVGNTPDLVGNLPPVLKVESAKSMTAKVGQPITLTAVATDDGKPRNRPMPAILGSNYVLPNSATGLRLSWFLYRGPVAVTFDPPQTKVWEDTRDSGNSPWSAGWKTPPVPADNKWTTSVTFGQPGKYVLRCLAHDGGLSVYEDVAVVVN